ncbi:MAG TPA: type II 3-dehydroquinate dehydratase [Methylotenera sp.]|nr:type II 3-dehydroquinate dehydratase [Methylotenera sp.]HPH04709.1 type II 3-dehydroquinate dehydratase [Methylotenera sp.]HPN01125.1 type II 3-dehydroquinate dehydratase [Methylotenera sp.]
MSAKSILVLHGPNLNLLGMREPELYGNTTLTSINQNLIEAAKQADVTIETFQSNSEADLVSTIQSIATKKVDFVIINPAAFTHTSVAMRDALSAVKVPFIEVHLSNVFAREAFRHHSYFTDIAVGIISGLGAQGYTLALEFAVKYVKQSTK